MLDLAHHRMIASITYKDPLLDVVSLKPVKLVTDIADDFLTLAATLLSALKLTIKLLYDLFALYTRISAWKGA